MIHTISQIRVRYAETDRMDVVYHSNYLVWFETARILMLDEIGIPYLEIEASNLRLPVLTASAAYKRPARFDDRLADSPVHARKTTCPLPLRLRSAPRRHTPRHWQDQPRLYGFKRQSPAPTRRLF